MNFMKKVLVYVLIACLVITCIPPMEASAAETSVPAADTASVEQTESANDDGLMMRDPADFGVNPKLRSSVPVDSSSLVHNSRFDDKYVIEHGVDISSHNGTVDWKKVKADGYDFAIIRMAYRGYGSAGTLKSDTQGKKNLENARAAGLKVGVYIFSQAINTKEAVEEAEKILGLIKGYDIDLPVVFDYEYTAKDDDGRLWVAKDKNGMTDTQRTNVCLAFCETVEAAGYDAMVYANRDMLENDLYADKIDSKYEIWLAEWTSKATYKNDYTYWQYTNRGSVNGVPSERVDLNVRYVHAPLYISKTAYTSADLVWAPVENAEGYILYRQTADGAAEEIARIEDPAVTTYKDSGLTMNTVYTYSLSYYVTDENGETVISDSGYPVQKTVTPLKLGKVSLAGTAPDAGSVKLTWKKTANATGYQIQRYNSSSKKYETVKTITSGNTVTYTNTGRKIGTSYKYRVRAFADVGGARVYGSYSDVVTIKTSSKLKKPVLTAKASSYTTNKLSWKKIPGATGYKVQRYNTSRKKWETIKTIKSGSTTSYSNTYLNSSTTYKYRVRATATLSGKTVNSAYSDTKASKTKGSRTAVVKNGPLNVRKGAGTKYGKLTKVKKGAKITVTGSTKSWYRIKVKVKGKYKTGYVLKKYVKLK